MEIKEALNRIKEHTHYHQYKEPKAIYITDALEMAITALSYREKLKPIAFKRTAHDFCNGVCEHSHYPCPHLNIYNKEYQYTDYKCPTCGKMLSDGLPYYCWFCGQAFDLSDIKKDI